eukprot:2589357-Rhodomonas_salina.2
MVGQGFGRRKLHCLFSHLLRPEAFKDRPTSQAIVLVAGVCGPRRVVVQGAAKLLLRWGLRNVEVENLGLRCEGSVGDPGRFHAAVHRGTAQPRRDCGASDRGEMRAGPQERGEKANEAA